MITTRYYYPGQIVTLYDHKKNKRFRGVLYIQPSTITLPDNLWERISKLFLGLAVLGFATVFFPPAYSEVSYRVANYFKKPQQIPAVSEIPISEEFFLEIPKINLISTIIPNVDAENEGQYLEKLKMGVAHAKGSYFPGDEGPIVLFSHSTDSLAHIIQYNAKFYALKDLEVGDSITIHFKGQTYNYKVKDKKVISPTNIDAIRQSDSKLILTTCWPPGTDWQRVAVFAS